MDLRLSDEQDLLRSTVREFAEAEIGPHVMEWDEAQGFPSTLLPKLAGLGLTGIQFSEEYGGAAMSALDYCICIEELARVCPAVALSVAVADGRIKKGDLVLLEAMGGGFTWGAAALRY